MRRLVMIGFLMGVCPLVRATDLGVSAAVTQCFADNEALRVQVAALQEELKSYQEAPQNEIPTQSEEPTEVQ